MCGRYVRAKDTVELQALFEASGDAPEPSWNIKPTQPIAVVYNHHGERVLDIARWGLVPPWAKEIPKYSTFNARSEGITGKATWKASVKTHRCLIPADGYYEWVTAGSLKVPHYIHPGSDSGLAFAGLYSWWPKDGDYLLTATILTMPTVPELDAIHDRNPVALPEDFWGDWLEGDGTQSLVDAAVAASKPVMAALTEHPVAPLKDDGPALISAV